MEPISPVLAEAYRLLEAGIYRYLDEAVYLAQFNTWTDEERELVRRSISDMNHIIRALVIEHECDDTGNCRKCGTAWPCDVTESINRLVKAPERVFYEILDHVRKLDSSIRTRGGA